MKDPIEVLRAIRDIFKVLPEKELKDYLAGLKNLARLRGLTSLVKKEVEDKMPVTIDISNDETYLAGMLEGEMRGLLEGIEVALDIKYGSEGLFLMDDIRNIGTIEKLEAFKEAVRKAASVNDLMRFLRG
ncbi:MAG: hypothetical protein HQK89_12245 [Nitrospirae bacterium]|nr:hypothetical protein [Nitrospirota bacterium]